MGTAGILTWPWFLLAAASAAIPRALCGLWEWRGYVGTAVSTFAQGAWGQAWEGHGLW